MSDFLRDGQSDGPARCSEDLHAARTTTHQRNHSALKIFYTLIIGAFPSKFLLEAAHSLCLNQRRFFILAFGQQLGRATLDLYIESRWCIP